MVIDSFIEWIVIAFGLMLALFVIAPRIPEITTVNDWLRRWGL
jgi:hypothetical protein